jgi:hypothetical protein
MTIVTSHLEHLGVRFEVLPHERAETAIEEARALGLTAGRRGEGGRPRHRVRALRWP